MVLALLEIYTRIDPWSHGLTGVYQALNFVVEVRQRGDVVGMRYIGYFTLGQLQKGLNLLAGERWKSNVQLLGGR